MFGSDDLDLHCFSKLDINILNFGGYGSKDLVLFFEVLIFLV